MEIQNKKSHESTVLQGNSIPHFQDHKNKGEYFSQKLKEIDKDIGIYEDLLKSAAAEEVNSYKETSPLFNVENLKNSLYTNPSLPKSQTLVPPLHKECTTYLHDITNSLGTNAFSETSVPAKWKHYLRISEGITATIDDLISSKRPIGLVIDQSELPSKKWCGMKRAPSDFVISSLSPFLVSALLVCFTFVF